MKNKCLYYIGKLYNYLDLLYLIQEDNEHYFNSVLVRTNKLSTFKNLDRLKIYLHFKVIKSMLLCTFYFYRFVYIEEHFITKYKYFK